MLARPLKVLVQLGGVDAMQPDELPRRTRRTARAAASQPDLQTARPVKALAHEARLAACGRP